MNSLIKNKVLDFAYFLERTKDDLDSYKIINTFKPFLYFKKMKYKKELKERLSLYNTTELLIIMKNIFLQNVDDAIEISNNSKLSKNCIWAFADSIDIDFKHYRERKYIYVSGIAMLPNGTKEVNFAKIYKEGKMYVVDNMSILISIFISDLLELMCMYYIDKKDYKELFFSKENIL